MQNISEEDNVMDPLSVKTNSSTQNRRTPIPLYNHSGSQGSSNSGQNENSNPSSLNGNLDSPEIKGNKTDAKSPAETSPQSPNKGSQQKSDSSNNNDASSPKQKGSSSPSLSGRDKGNKNQLKLIMNKTSGNTDDFSNASQLSEKEIIGTPLKDVNKDKKGEDESKKEELKIEKKPSSTTPTTQVKKISLEDFQKLAPLGRGAYAEVFLVKRITDDKKYALKAIDKNFMKRERKEHQVYVEKEVLCKLDHPGIIKLHSSFQDKARLYFVLEYVGGGEFSDYIRVMKKLPKDQIKFFTAEIVSILEYLHSKGYAHRDLKPENLLLTTENHLKAIDFGTAKNLNENKRTSDLFNVKQTETVEMDPDYEERKHRSSFVGTAQYVSPEMLDDSDCGIPGDLWALGCTVYLMEMGEFPFHSTTEWGIFEKIKNMEVDYPSTMDPDVKDLVQKLLVKEPFLRLGAGSPGSDNDYAALKAHPLFDGINFKEIFNSKAPVEEVSSPHKKRQLQKVESDEDLIIKMMSGNTLMDKVVQKSPLSEKKDPEIILSGLVSLKGSFLFYKTKRLTLTNEPRLLLFNAENQQLEGEIPLDKTTRASMDTETKFVVNGKKKYTFKEMEHAGMKWVSTINGVISNLL